MKWFKMQLLSAALCTTKANEILQKLQLIDRIRIALKIDQDKKLVTIYKPCCHAKVLQSHLIPDLLQLANLNQNNIYCCTHIFNIV